MTIPMSVSVTIKSGMAFSYTMYLLFISDPVRKLSLSALTAPRYVGASDVDVGQSPGPVMSAACRELPPR